MRPRLPYDIMYYPYYCAVPGGYLMQYVGIFYFEHGTFDLIKAEKRFKIHSYYKSPIGELAKRHVYNGRDEGDGSRGA